MGGLKRSCTISLALLLSNCGLVTDQLSPGRTTIRGVVPDIERMSDPLVGAQAETLLIEALSERAGLYAGNAPKKAYQLNGPDWKPIMFAGVRMIDGQCDQYLDSLFRFNREQRAARQGLSATAAAAGVFMGLASAGATAIAMTAAAFGLSTNLFDAGTTSVLFTIEPSALRNVVLEGRTKYLKGLTPADVSSRPQTMIALQGYLTQCSPAAIEANINNAANGSRNSVTSSNETDSEHAAKLAAPGTALTFGAQPPITKPPNPPGATPGRVDNRTLAERNIPESKIAEIQTFLGVTPDRDIGPPGSRTRLAIMEFEAGMVARNATGTGPWAITGTLTGSTRDVLTTIVNTRTDQLLSPFERAFMGNLDPVGTDPKFTTVDRERLRNLWSLMVAPGETDPSGAELYDAVRRRILAKRVELNLGIGRTFVDSQMWTRLRR
jgi:hypothetical protein